MSLGRLDALQARVLAVLAPLEPRWTLTGGGALAGFYTQHRTTRDLDLFVRDHHTLGTIVADARALLHEAGFSVNVVRSTPTFSQLDVRDRDATVLVDLVADPTPIAESPVSVMVGDTSILIDTPHQLLINKLCALLSRSEIRDLVDVRALRDAGGDIERALHDCPRQDGGFSSLTFAWSLQGIPLERLARASGASDDDVEALVALRTHLITIATTGARPAS